MITLYVLANVAYLVTLPLAQIQTAPDDRVATAADGHQVDVVGRRRRLALSPREAPLGRHLRCVDEADRVVRRRGEGAGRRGALMCYEAVLWVDAVRCASAPVTSPAAAAVP